MVCVCGGVGVDEQKWQEKERRLFEAKAGGGGVSN